MSLGVKTSKIKKNYFGRYELTIANRGLTLDEATVQQILETLLPTHFVNRHDINVLKGYYEGNQEILNKIKNIRPEINHKVVENNAFHLVEFKKGFVFGEPIQYIQRDKANVTELDLFNDFMIDNNKSSEDKDLAEDLYVSGVGYRITLPKANNELPFIIKNLDNRDTFVVYNNNIEKEKLLAGCMFKLDEDLWEIMVYTENKVFYYHYEGNPDLQYGYNLHNINKSKRDQNNKSKKVKLDYQDTKPNPMKEIPIVEYKLNKSRIGIIELVMGSLDALNFITSSDLDDIDQFIQSFLVFINQEIDREELTSLMDIGALQIRSTGNLQADVKLLTNKLSHSETKILYDRIYNNMLTIAGVPRMSDKGSGGDTGQARMLGEGWTMADSRAIQDELSFKIAERETMRLALNICKGKSSVGIKELTPRQIEIKFTRSRSDNMLVKTQSLMNLKNAEVAPEVAFSTVGLFSDPHEAMLLSRYFYGDKFWQKEEKEQVVEKEEVAQEDPLDNVIE